VIRGIFWGLTVAWIGAWIYLGNLYPALLSFKIAWPLILTIIGLFWLLETCIWAAKRRRWFSGWSFFWSLLVTAFGTGLWLSNAAIIPVTFAQWWPVIIVILGITIIISVIIKTTHRPKQVGSIIDQLEEGKIDVDTAVDEIRKTKTGRGEAFGVTVDVDIEKNKRRRAKRRHE
jgi:hypothetical protein